MTEDPVEIRAEAAGDRDGVRRVVVAAFGREAEARLVDALRGRVTPELSRVALVRQEIVGHVYFSPVRVGDASRQAMALGPVSVAPAWQGRGIGARLCREGLAACRARGENVVFVLGDPDYYRRFGFEPALPHGLYYKSREYAPAFFVAALDPGAIAGFEGEVHYHPAFDAT